MNPYIIITSVSIGAAALIGITYLIKEFNILTKLNQEVLNSLGNLKAEYQRRKDLFNNLNLLIVSYINFEQKTFKDVTNQRTQEQPKESGKMENILKEIVDKQIKENQNPETSQADLFKESVGMNVKAISERYPKLKAFVEYKKILEQIEVTEDRISKERKTYNKEVLNFNKYIKTFPHNLISALFGFYEYEYFEDNETSKFKFQVL